MAKQFLNLDYKLALLDMAQAWVRLADITEKFGDALLATVQQNKPIA
jgi:hypothetical protein